MCRLMLLVDSWCTAALSTFRNDGLNLSSDDDDDDELLGADSDLLPPQQPVFGRFRSTPIFSRPAAPLGTA